MGGKSASRLFIGSALAGRAGAQRSRGGGESLPAGWLFKAAAGCRGPRRATIHNLQSTISLRQSIGYRRSLRLLFRWERVPVYVEKLPVHDERVGGARWELGEKRERASHIVICGTLAGVDYGVEHAEQFCLHRAFRDYLSPEEILKKPSIGANSVAKNAPLIRISGDRAGFRRRRVIPPGNEKSPRN